MRLKCHRFKEKNKPSEICNVPRSWIMFKNSIVLIRWLQRINTCALKSIFIPRSFIVLFPNMVGCAKFVRMKNSFNTPIILSYMPQSKSQEEKKKETNSYATKRVNSQIWTLWQTRLSGLTKLPYDECPRAKTSLSGVMEVPKKRICL